MRLAWPGATVENMQAVRRLAGVDPGMVVDAALGIIAAGLTAAAAWGPRGLIAGSTIVGPLWLRALLPLLMGTPLLLRRREPLLMWTALWAGIALQSLLAQGQYADSLHFQFGPYPETPVAFIFVLFAGAYALGAHASLPRAAAGLILAVPVTGEISHQGWLGLAFHSSDGDVTVAKAMVQLVAFCLAGVLVRARSQALWMVARNSVRQRQAEQAAAAERARIARELHDIIAHHLSVVVLHAAGARAAGRADPATLEEIEHSGRQALTETRRLFGVLRDPDEQTGRAPQPGISELPALVGSLCATGLEVSLSLDGDYTELPPALNVSAYRIVQEALTNVLKHAGPARAEVTVGRAGSAVTIEVTDDGPGNPTAVAPGGGQGLAGMRERVAMFGGDLRAGPRPGGGFTVCARLPIREPL
jgi:signal transduction histidine kinase